MARKLLKIGLVSVALVTAGYVATVIYAMSEMSMLHLIMCSTGEGSTRIPSRVCEYYMKSFRGNEDDMKELAMGGVDTILNGESKKKYEVAAYFIAKGLDVNGVNHNYQREPRDVTPLHASVLYNDAERTKFLIDHGADPTIKSKSYSDMTPLDLAQVLQKKHPNEDRSELIRLLSGATTATKAPVKPNRQ